MNPWGASAWQFLDKVHRHWMRHVMFVLQQCDLRTPEEIAAILDYMKQLTRQRFEREFPIYPVSAKKAYLARSSGLDRERLMAESGFGALEEHISKSLGSSGPRVSKLANALRIAWEILSAIQQHTGTRMASREDKSGVLRNIDAEIATHRERTLSKLEPIVEATASDLQHECEDLVRRIRQRLTTRFALKCVFAERRKVEGLSKSLIEAVRTPALERWERAAAIVEDDVGACAAYLAEEIQEGLKVQMRDELKPDESFWKAQRRRFSQRMDQIVSQTVQGMALEEGLSPALPKSRRFAALLIFLVLPSLITAVVLASMGHWTAAVAIEAAGLVVGGGIWFICSRMLKRHRAAAEIQFAKAVPELRKIFSTQLRDDVNNLYDSFNRILEPMREKLSEQERRQNSFNEQIESLAKTFTGLNEELRQASAAQTSGHA
jgi:hypothetical protein